MSNLIIIGHIENRNRVHERLREQGNNRDLTTDRTRIHGNGRNPEPDKRGQAGEERNMREYRQSQAGAVQSAARGSSAGDVLRENEQLHKTVLTGLMAALCYVAFTFLKIPVPTPGGGMVALHIGNAFCVLAALILGGVNGGLAGAIGMTIADLMDPAYVSSAPKTFVLKFLIGLIAGLVAHKLGHITDDHTPGYIFRWSLFASALALGFNVIADPVVGYLYKTYLLGIPQDVSKIMATWAAGVTAFNSAVGTIVVVVVYGALRPVLKKSGQFFHL